jgi:UDP-N-acetylglucosamine 2-epimerase (non-hydrolysing)
MRNNTERPVTVVRGTNRLLGTDPAALADIPELLDGWSPPTMPIEGWDGHAAERAAATLLTELCPGASMPGAVPLEGARAR